MHVGTAIAAYLDSRRHELAAETVATFREDLHHLATFTGWQRPVTDLTVDMLCAWAGEQTVAPATLQKRISTVRTWCRWLVAHGQIDRDPTILLPRIRRPRRVPRALSRAQVEGLWQVPMPPRTRLCVSLMLFEGLRRGEVARLEWGDVRLRERQMLISGKGGHERVLPISDTTASLLTQVGIGTSGPVVRSQVRPHCGVTPATVSTLVRDVMRAAGLGESPHALRHTAATDALTSGCDLRTVQKFLGHSTVVVTESYLPWQVAELGPAVREREYAFALQ